VNWLNHDKSLREQGVGENDTVRLRKKFFFSDQNVDRNDPVQLNLMYVQARDDILKATHPCSADEAVQFAAMQCQVQLGDHNPQTHTALDLSKYLPAEHAKAKGMEKRILQEHRKLKGLTELNAKYRYIQLCRSLKTYGMTFFLVKEKVWPGANGHSHAQRRPSTARHGTLMIGIAMCRSRARTRLSRGCLGSRAAPSCGSTRRPRR
jgi:talin